MGSTHPFSTSITVQNFIHNAANINHSTIFMGRLQCVSPFSFRVIHVFPGWILQSAHGCLCSGLYTTVLLCHEAMPSRRIMRCRGKCWALPPALPHVHSVSDVQFYCLVLCVSLWFCVDSASVSSSIGLSLSPLCAHWSISLLKCLWCRIFPRLLTPERSRWLSAHIAMLAVFSKVALNTWESV